MYYCPQSEEVVFLGGFGGGVGGGGGRGFGGPGFPGLFGGRDDPVRDPITGAARTSLKRTAKMVI